MAPHQQQQFTLPGYGESVMWSVQPVTWVPLLPLDFIPPRVPAALPSSMPSQWAAVHRSLALSIFHLLLQALPVIPQPWVRCRARCYLLRLAVPNAPGLTAGPTFPSPTSPASPTQSVPTSPSSPSPIVPVAPTSPTGPTFYSVSGTSAISVSISPTSVYLQAGQSIAFVAAVLGTANQQVQWTMSPNLGTLVNGFYTAPASYSSETQVTISATSYADPTKVGTATVLLGQPITSPHPDRFEHHHFGSTDQLHADGRAVRAV